MSLKIAQFDLKRHASCFLNSMWRKHLKFAAFLLLFTSQAGAFSNFNLHTQWNTHQIEVCYLSSSLEAHQKITSLLRQSSEIRSLSANEKSFIRSSFEQVNALQLGMKFTGFKDCNPSDAFTDHASIAVAAENNQNGEMGASDIGDRNLRNGAPKQGLFYNGLLLNFDRAHEQSEKICSTVKTVLTETWAPKQKRKQEITLQDERCVRFEEETNRQNLFHEIGHALGLVHEQARTDAFIPEWCESISADTEADHDPGFPYETFKSKYDVFSVMNYCSTDIIRDLFAYETLCHLMKYADWKRLPLTDQKMKEIVKHCKIIGSHPFAPQFSNEDLSILTRVYHGTHTGFRKEMYRSELENALNAFTRYDPAASLVHPD